MFFQACLVHSILKTWHDLQTGGIIVDILLPERILCLHNKSLSCVNFEKIITGNIQMMRFHTCAIDGHWLTALEVKIVCHRQ